MRRVPAPPPRSSLSGPVANPAGSIAGATPRRREAPARRGRAAWPCALGLVGLVGLLGCAPGPAATTGLSGGESTGDLDPTTTTTTSTSAATTSSAAATTEASTSADGSASTTDESAGTTRGPLIDVGVDTDTGAPVPLGCHGKIDYLFVISRTAAMGPHLDALAGSIAEFTALLDGPLAAFDPHILITDGDKYWGNDAECPLAACPIDGGCAAIDAPDYPCWAAHDGGMISECDTTFGAGVIFPAAKDAANEPCPFKPGRRYLGRDDPDLAGALACAADLGTNGPVATTGRALFDAVSTPLNDPSGCNAGFLRDDALLVVTVVHPTIEGNTTYYSPLAWANQIVAAKSGDRDAVIAVGILDDRDAADRPICPGEPTVGVGTFREMLSYLDHAVSTSICRPSYGDAFAAMAAEVEAICGGASG